MSQNETLKAVTCEWQTTQEIADKIPKSKKIDSLSHLTAVYGDLAKLKKYGIVESMKTNGKPIKWRTF